MYSARSEPKHRWAGVKFSESEVMSVSTRDYSKENLTLMNEHAVRVLEIGRRSLKILELYGGKSLGGRRSQSSWTGSL